MNTPKEDAYDELISPLMEQIIALCKEHKINMAAQFALDHDDYGAPLYCTTGLSEADPDDLPGSRRVVELYRIMQPRGAPLFTFTVVTPDPSAKP